VITNSTHNFRKLSLLALSATFLSLVGILPVSAEGTRLEGFVNAQDVQRTKSNPSLERKNVPDLGDQFSQPEAGPGMELFDAPAAAFDNQRAFAPPPPTTTFGLNASAEDRFQGVKGTPVESAFPAMAPQSILPPINGGVSSDPDNTEYMQLQWDLWHKRVAESIFMRFDQKAKQAFANSPPISCQASYTVTRDGRLVNVRLLRSSNDMGYNMMLMNVLNSMNGNPLLQFPPGSQRQFVCKTGEFSRNCGMNGYKHTVNDNERISGSMRSGYPH
jgi:hypothetical protein